MVIVLDVVRRCSDESPRCESREVKSLIFSGERRKGNRLGAQRQSEAAETKQIIHAIGAVQESGTEKSKGPHRGQ